MYNILNWRSVPGLLFCVFYVVVPRTYWNQDCGADQKSRAEILYKGQSVPSQLILQDETILLCLYSAG